MGGSKQSTSSTQTSSNPAYLQPQYDTAASNLNSLYGSGSLATYYPNSTVAAQDPLTSQALGMVANRATTGSQTQALGNQVYQNTLNGNYLNPSTNPYLSGAMDAANSATIRQYQNAIAPGVASSFSQAGRYGSEAYNSAQSDAENNLANTLANSNATLAYGNYSQERQNQLNAAGSSPQLASADYNDANALLSAGQTNQAQTQAQLSDQVNRYNSTNGTTALENYIDLLNGIKGNTGTVTGTTTQTQASNPLLDGLSALSGVAGLASSFSNPFSAATALGGGLFSTQAAAQAFGNSRGISYF